MKVKAAFFFCVLFCTIFPVIASVVDKDALGGASAAAEAAAASVEVAEPSFEGSVELTDTGVVNFIEKGLAAYHRRIEDQVKKVALPDLNMSSVRRDCDEATFRGLNVFQKWKHCPGIPEFLFRDSHLGKLLNPRPFRLNLSHMQISRLSLGPAKVSCMGEICTVHLEIPEAMFSVNAKIDDYIKGKTLFQGNNLSFTLDQGKEKHLAKGNKLTLEFKLKFDGAKPAPFELVPNSIRLHNFNRVSLSLGNGEVCPRLKFSGPDQFREVYEQCKSSFENPKHFLSFAKITNYLNRTFLSSKLVREVVKKFLLHPRVFPKIAAKVNEGLNGLAIFDEQKGHKVALPSLKVQDWVYRKYHVANHEKLIEFGENALAEIFKGEGFTNYQKIIKFFGIRGDSAAAALVNQRVSDVAFSEPTSKEERDRLKDDFDLLHKLCEESTSIDPQGFEFPEKTESGFEWAPVIQSDVRRRWAQWTKNCGELMGKLAKAHAEVARRHLDQGLDLKLGLQNQKEPQGSLVKMGVTTQLCSVDAKVEMRTSEKVKVERPAVEKAVTTRLHDASFDFAVKVPIKFINDFLRRLYAKKYLDFQAHMSDEGGGKGCPRGRDIEVALDKDQKLGYGELRERCLAWDESRNGYALEVPDIHSVVKLAGPVKTHDHTHFKVGIAPEINSQGELVLNPEVEGGTHISFTNHLGRGLANLFKNLFPIYPLVANWLINSQVEYRAEDFLGKPFVLPAFQIDEAKTAGLIFTELQLTPGFFVVKGRFKKEEV